jgi:hypothetical protein
MWEERAIRFMSEARQVEDMANRELGGSIHVQVFSIDGEEQHICNVSAQTRNTALDSGGER